MDGTLKTIEALHLNKLYPSEVERELTEGIPKLINPLGGKRSRFPSPR